MRAHVSGVVLGLMLAGCGMLPRPFAPDAPAESGTAVDAVALMGPRASLMVTPAEGLDAYSARGVAEGLAGELRKRDIAAFTRAGGRASWLLQLSAADPTRTTWRLVDPSGRIAAEGGGSQDPAALARQVETAVAGIGRPAPAERRLAVRLGPVDGVSAEAARLLGLALQAELRRAGVPVVLAGADALVLTGRVNRTDVGGGAEEIEIAWTVAQPDGGEIGTIGQSNRLPKGQIDSRWAAVAGAVATGLADGILDIVEAVEASRK
jgi:hypothetical protein